MSAPITITVRFTVDPDAWREEYGTDETRAQIRDAARYMAVDGLATGVFGHITHVVKVER